MSFILQVFHAPQARTIEEADAAMDALGDASFGDRARFTRFIEALTAIYPNSDDEDAAFPEGLTADHLDDAVYVFAVNLDRLDENLMAHVAACAGAQSLHVLDPQNGLLYRSDRQVVDMQGRARPLPTPRAVAPPAPRRRLPADMTEKNVLERVQSELCRRLAHEGFERDPRWGDPRRMRGPVQQSIDIAVLDGYEDVSLRASLGLRCRPVTRVWLEGLGGEGATFVNQLAERGWQFPDFRLFSSQLRIPPSQAAQELGMAKVASESDWNGVMAWLDRWIAWLQTEGLDDLSRMDRPAGIAHYVLNEAQLQMMFRRNDLHPSELFHRYVLVGAYAGARKDEWIRGFWDHYGRSSLRFESKDTPERIYHQFKEKAERFLAWLDTGDFARAAQRLRALD